MTDQPPRLFVLLPVHNRRELTERFAAQLARQTWRGFELVLIDDGSTDGTAEAVVAILPRTTVVRGRGDWWWAGALAQGCRHLEGIGVRDDDVVLLINDDVTFDAGFLEAAMSELAGNGGGLLLARQVDDQTGSEIGSGGGVCADPFRMRFVEAKHDEEINCMPTRGLFLRWGDLRRVGGFVPEALPHYLSDYEFTYRCWRKGLALRVARRARVSINQRKSGESLDTLFRLPRGRRFGLLFSRRFKDNPVTWTRFVALTVFPPVLRPITWAKIWMHFVWVVARCVIVSPGDAPRASE